MLKLSTFNRFISLESVGVIHNFRTGKGLFIDTFDEPVISSLPNETRIKMIEYGMIIEGSRNEISELQKERTKILQSTDVIMMTIVLTSMCNLRCSYCFEEGIDRRESNHGIVESTIRFLESRPIPKMLDIRWFGGEPLINIKALRQIYEYVLKYVEKNRIAYSSELVTNGTLLDNDNVTLLANMGINSIQVSIDGTRDIHDKFRPYKNGKGTYIDIVEGLNRLVSIWSGNIIIRINVSKSNYEYIPRAVDLLCQMPFASQATFSFDYMMPNGQSDTSDYFSEVEFSVAQIDLIQYAQSRSLSTIPLFPKSRKAMFCLAEANYYGIIQAGLEVVKCDFDIGKQTFSLLKPIEGNIEHMVNQKGIKCVSCQLLPICMGGCKKKGTCPIFFHTIDDRLKLYYNIMNLPIMNLPALQGGVS
jgi:uncharacterized protein